MEDIGYYIKAFVTLLMLVNPFEGMPVFISATGTATPELRNSILRITCLSVIVILVSSLLFGRMILQVFSITTGAFQIGGGIILFLIAVKMTLGPSGAMKEFSGGGELKPSFGIVPLALPLLAGPGAINGAILFGTGAHPVTDMLVLIGVAFLVGIILYIMLKTGNTLARYIGTTGIEVVTRVTGLFIAAISAEMVIKGMASTFRLVIF
ncbi:MAG: hypothetical protein COV46_03620 [Deltaproteobacteria bacterium CG11_big_fil_rev_8_21_14_0_20_49_13]|nr:MAG: hypothetical protein COV46_03620 [Deltaproteobacteria bacterium CG11_big_fil_rev_8_21_14_0_20_49_13]